MNPIDLIFSVFTDFIPSFTLDYVTVITGVCGLALIIFAFHSISDFLSQSFSSSMSSRLEELHDYAEKNKGTVQGDLAAARYRRLVRENESNIFVGSAKKEPLADLGVLVMENKELNGHRPHRIDNSDISFEYHDDLDNLRMEKDDDDLANLSMEEKDDDDLSNLRMERDKF